MIDITNASLRWAGDRVWVTSGDPELAAGESGQPIDGLQSAAAAAWLCATDGHPVDAIHAALLQLDKYEQFFREP
jgi:hypothetical protein